MKKFFVFLVILMCTVSLYSCNTSNNSAQDIEDSSLSENEPTCNEIGHNYDKGVCTKCGEIIVVDMNERISKPTFMEFSLNSANGMKTFWGANNISGKTIKYCHITFVFENAVGDPAYDEHTGKNSVEYRLTGPVEPNEQINLRNEIIGYCADCFKVTIDEITLEYMDGSKETGHYGWSINEFYSYER